MKEAMRCHPGVSYPLERVVPPGGANLCGVHLNEGTIVGVNPVVIHRDTSIFGEDALQFNPERWLGNDTEHIKSMDRHLMTVGYQPGMCTPTFLSERMNRCCTDPALLVWIWFTNLCWQKHFHYGDGQASTASPARLRSGMGVPRSRVACLLLLVR